MWPRWRALPKSLSHTFLLGSAGRHVVVLPAPPWVWGPLTLQHLFSHKGASHQSPLPAQLIVIQSLSPVQLFVTPRTVARQASLSFTISQSLLKLMSIESVMPSNHLILWHPLLFLPSMFLSIRVFSNRLHFSITELGYSVAIFVSFLFKILLWTISNALKVKRIIFIYIYIYIYICLSL